MEFSALPLHDAVLTSIHISLNADRCDLRILPIGTQAHCLTFEDFENLQFPRKEPWGPSQSINMVREPASGSFEIELQLGDVLRIEAAHWAYRAEG